jgi:hypothetical protein
LLVKARGEPRPCSRFPGRRSPLPGRSVRDIGQVGDVLAVARARKARGYFHWTLAGPPRIGAFGERHSVSVEAISWPLEPGPVSVGCLSRRGRAAGHDRSAMMTILYPEAEVFSAPVRHDEPRFVRRDDGLGTVTQPELA